MLDGQTIANELKENVKRLSPKKAEFFTRAVFNPHINFALNPIEIM